MSSIISWLEKHWTSLTLRNWSYPKRDEQKEKKRPLLKSKCTHNPWGLCLTLGLLTMSKVLGQATGLALWQTMTKLSLPQKSLSRNLLKTLASTEIVRETIEEFKKTKGMWKLEMLHFFQDLSVLIPFKSAQMIGDVLINMKDWWLASLKILKQINKMI